MNRANREALASHERSIIDGAVRFSAFVRLGPANATKEECASLEAAIAAALVLSRMFARPALVYAIDAQDRSTMLGSANRGAWRPLS